MTRRTWCALFVAWAAVGVCLWAGTADAGKFNKKLSIGDAAPKWKALVGTDDRPHGLEDFKKAKVVVIAFTCNTCPVAKAYEDRFVKFAKDYKSKDVAFVAINCNNGQADLPDKMKDRAKEKKFTFPYLHDSKQTSGAEYGATTTPHLFVLDQNRRIAYMGIFDNEMIEEQAEKHYVRDAVEALLAGKKPEVAETRQFGCGITYDKK